MESEISKECEIKTSALEDCKRERRVDSCLKCDEIIGCAIRKEYVESVYTSMSANSGNSFNFETE